MNLLNRIADWFVGSRHFHVRQNVAANAGDLVCLIDRFVDDKLKFPLEWDDFISWENENPGIEAVRKKLSALEPLFFSSNKLDRHQALKKLIQERNCLAGLCGLPLRPES
ncbi:MAG: hypothetical protein QM741_00035 [Rudaea sp.]|uniref:hypothetical protein n=1 Tax=Rudaea sp. TaxID=2136325 RepID=UPI0039E6FE25